MRSVYDRLRYNLVDLLEQHHLRQLDLAALIGRSDASLSHWLNRRREIKLRHLDAIAQALGVDVVDLLAPQPGIDYDPRGTYRLDGALRAEYERRLVRLRQLHAEFGAVLRELERPLRPWRRDATWPEDEEERSENGAQEAS